MPQKKPKPTPEPEIAASLGHGKESASISDIFLSPLDDALAVRTLEDIKAKEVVIDAVDASKALVDRKSVV